MRLTLCLLLTSLVAVAAIPSAASAQETSQEDDEAARRHFESGRDYFDRGQYEEAAREFQEAYRLSVRPQLLINLARTLEALGRTDEAVQALDQWLSVAPQDDADRVTITERVERLRSRARLEAEARAANPTPEPTAPPPPPPPDHTGQHVLGAVLGGVGVASWASSWGFYAWRMQAGTAVGQVANDPGGPDYRPRQQTWIDRQTPILVTAAVGGALMAASMPFWLPEEEGVPWWSWIVGGVGVAALAAGAVEVGLGAPSCDQGGLVDFGCVDQQAGVDRGVAWFSLSAPLLAVPITYLLRDVLRTPVTATTEVSADRLVLGMTGAF